MPNLSVSTLDDIFHRDKYMTEIPRNDRNAIEILRQYMAAKKQLEKEYNALSAHVDKVHQDHKAGLIETQDLGQRVMDAMDYRSEEIADLGKEIAYLWEILKAWHDGQDILIFKLSTQKP